MLGASPEELHSAVDNNGELPTHLLHKAQAGRARGRPGELRDVGPARADPAFGLVREHQHPSYDRDSIPATSTAPAWLRRYSTGSVGPA
jgi:hypothetical protein